MMMMVRIGMFYGELGSSTLCLSHRCNNSTLSHIHKHPSPLISPNYAATHTHNKRLVASASSAPSVSGSGAEYSGILFLFNTSPCPHFCFSFLLSFM